MSSIIDIMQVFHIFFIKLTILIINADQDEAIHV